MRRPRNIYDKYTKFYHKLHVRLLFLFFCFSLVMVMFYMPIQADRGILANHVVVYHHAISSLLPPPLFPYPILSLSLSPILPRAMVPS